MEKTGNQAATAPPPLEETVTTAYQSYQKPIDDLNAHYEREENVWDGRLSDREMAENGLQKQLQRVGSDLNIWEIGDEKRWRLLNLLTEHQSYPKAVELFLKEEA